MKLCKTCGENPPQNGRGVCSRCRARRDRAVKRKTAKNDASEHQYGTEKVPLGYSLRGVSQLVDAEGKTKLQWIKTDRDKEQRLEEFLEACESSLSKVRKAPKLTKPKGNRPDDLINIIPIGDMHIGLMTWWREVGQSYDLDKAVETYRCAFRDLITSAPKAGTLVLCDVGDLFHSDGPGDSTTKGTPVDVDGRFPKIFEAAIDLFVYAVDVGLLTHDKVEIIMVPGNHDKHVKTYLAAALSRHYRAEKRVTVSEGFKKFQYRRFGKVLIGVTHGDTVKPNAMGEVMACDRPKDWGDTVHRHWYTGHLHHERQMYSKVVGQRGCTVETATVLVPTDAWHHECGYRSSRDIRLDTWHSEYGRTNRLIRSATYIQDMIG